MLTTSNDLKDAGDVECGRAASRESKMVHPWRLYRRLTRYRCFKQQQGRGWWKTAADPWQFLACFKKLKVTLQPGDLMLNLAVYQDGTCNGLQHHAALGDDSRGAQQVDLGATDEPSDVYTCIVEMAQQVIDEDVGKGDKYAQMLRGKIVRKVMKQTICFHFQVIEVASISWCRRAGHNHRVRRHLYQRPRSG